MVQVSKGPELPTKAILLSRALDSDEISMSKTEPQVDNLTQLLEASSAGDQAAFEQLIEAVYPVLHKAARRQLADQRKETSLDATSLVNEAYLRLADETRVQWQSRGHFFAIAALTMRRILVDQARRRKARKRGSGERPVTLDSELLALEGNSDTVLAVDAALDELEKFTPQLSRVVECRFFAGMTTAETAEALDSSVRTVERNWTRARAWLAEKLSEMSG